MFSLLFIDWEAVLWPQVMLDVLILSGALIELHYDGNSVSEHAHALVIKILVFFFPKKSVHAPK